MFWQQLSLAIWWRTSQSWFVWPLHLKTKTIIWRNQWGMACYDAGTYPWSCQLASRQYHCLRHPLILYDKHTSAFNSSICNSLTFKRQSLVKQFNCFTCSACIAISFTSLLIIICIIYWHDDSTMWCYAKWGCLKVNHWAHGRYNR